MKIIVVGDIHTHFEDLKLLLNIQNPDIILSVGDFGYWPRQYGCLQNIQNIRLQNHQKLYFCDGNHEDHWELRNLENNEIAKNIFYMKRGSILEINNKKIMFIGGAESYDRYQRTIGYDWFPEELISQNDIYNLPNEKIDTIISHTCPFDLYQDLKIPIIPYRIDPSMHALSTVLNNYKPKQWFFGHWHQYMQVRKNTTYFYCLDHIRSKNKWWMEINI